MDGWKVRHVVAAGIALVVLDYALKRFPMPPVRTIRFILMGAVGGGIGITARYLIDFPEDPPKKEKLRFPAVGMLAGGIVGIGLASNVHIHLYQPYFRGTEGFWVLFVGAVIGLIVRGLIRLSRPER